MLTQFTEKTLKYKCDACYFKSVSKTDYDRHCLTAKHQKYTNLTHNNNLLTQITQTHICTQCNKVYKSRVGLWGHTKKCHNSTRNEAENVCLLRPESSTSAPLSTIYGPSTYGNSNNVPFNIHSYNGSSSLQNTMELYSTQPQPDTELLNNNIGLIIEILKQNQTILLENKEFKDMIVEQNKTILDLATKAGNTTIHNSSTTNNKFNLHIFLNETCKDAVNINDFIKDLPVSFQQLENIGQNGYVAGITDIILSKLKSMDITERPLHCTDIKRDILYIREANEWVKDNEDNTKMTQIFRRIAKNNTRTILEWSKQNPISQESDTKENIFCLGVMLNSLGAIGDAQIKYDNKVLKNIAKAVYIDKY